MITRKIKRLNESAWNLRNNDYPKAMDYCRQVLTLLDVSPHRGERAKCLIAMAWCLCEQGDLDQSYTLAEESEALLDNSELVYLFPFLKQIKGTLFWKKGDLDKGLSNFQEQYRAAKEIKDWCNEAEALNNIGLIQLEHKDYSRSISSFSQAYDLYHKHEYLHGQVLTLNNLAMLHHIKTEYKLAINTAERALTILSQGVNRPVVKAALWDTLGLCYMDSKEYEKAFDYFRKSVSLSEKMSMGGPRALGLFRLGRLYYLQGELDIALTWLEEAVDLIQSYDMNTELIHCYHYMVEIYDKQGNEERVKYYNDKYAFLQEKIFS
jgi:tetratricopeptide (TPR) repeat protein